MDVGRLGQHLQLERQYLLPGVVVDIPIVDLVAELVDKLVAPGQAKPVLAPAVDLDQRQPCSYIALDLEVVAKDRLIQKLV